MSEQHKHQDLDQHKRDVVLVGAGMAALDMAATNTHIQSGTPRRQLQSAVVHTPKVTNQVQEFLPSRQGGQE